MPLKASKKRRIPPNVRRVRSQGADPRAASPGHLREVRQESLGRVVYDSAPDPYCYPGTTVLINLAGIREQATLDAFEDDAATQRAEEPSLSVA